MTLRALPDLPLHRDSRGDGRTSRSSVGSQRQLLATNLTSTLSEESAGRECRRSGEPVDPVVVRIARVAPDPHEGHVSPSVPYQTEQPLPEVSVLDRAVGSLPGAIAQPPLVPVWLKHFST